MSNKDDDEQKKRRMQRAGNDILAHTPEERERIRKEKEMDEEIQEQEEIESIIQELEHYSKLIGEAASKEIVYNPPWISYENAPIIADASITLVQGKAKSHKSRLAETFCSLLLSHGKKQLMGFKKYTMSNSYCVLYVDTERAHLTDFAAALQRIKTGAGHNKMQPMENLIWYSIKMRKREKRLISTKAAIIAAQRKMEQRGLKGYGLLVVLDVISDCIVSFNNDADSNKFYDYIGMLCETYGVSFLLVLHENPGSEKARGHLGTEGMNKASTVIQIGYEKDSGGENTEIIKIKILASRNAPHLQPIYVQFKEGQLTDADPTRVKEIAKEKGKAGSMEIAAEALERIFSEKADGENIGKQDILTLLAAEAGISERTAERRINDIVALGYIITDKQGRPCNLVATRATGRPTVYGLEISTKAKSDGPGDYSSDDLPF